MHAQVIHMHETGCVHDVYANLYWHTQKTCTKIVTSSPGKYNCQRFSFSVQCSQRENQVPPCCHDPGIHRVHTPRSWYVYLMARHQHITWHDAHSPCWANKQGKSFYLHVLQWLILHYPSPELSWVGSCLQTSGHKCQHWGFCHCEIWRYILPWKVLHLVPNQSATVSTREHSCLSSGNSPQNKMF